MNGLRAFHKSWLPAKQPTTHLSPASYLHFDSYQTLLINKLQFAMHVHLQPLASTSKQCKNDDRETCLSVCISPPPTPHMLYMNVCALS